MTNVYLAAQFARQEEISKKADVLRSMGFTVVSRWLDPIHNIDHTKNVPEQSARISMNDQEDIGACDVCINITEPTFDRCSRGTGGRNVEFGIALGYGKKNVVIGPQEHVFHYNPSVSVFSCWEEFLVHAGEFLSSQFDG